VDGLDSLRTHGVLDFGGERWLAAAVRDSAAGLVVMTPVQDVIDSTLAPILGADLVMIRPRPLQAGLDSLREYSSAFRDSIDELDLPEATADSLALMRARAVARSLGLADSVVKQRERHHGLVVASGRDTLSGALLGFGLTGQVSLAGVRLTPDGWQDDRFALSVHASLRSILTGLFSKVRENPWQAVPVAALVLLGLLLLPLFSTNLGMVRGMGVSITRAIGALRQGAHAFGEGRLAHRIPIEGTMTCGTRRSASTRWPPDSSRPANASRSAPASRTSSRSRGASRRASCPRARRASPGSMSPGDRIPRARSAATTTIISTSAVAAGCSSWPMSRVRACRPRSSCRASVPRS
jgi:HAMP domain-containing protein